MKKLLAVSLILTSFATLAQGPDEDSKSRSRNSRKERIIRNTENYNAFKFDPVRLVIGEMNFSWEHRIDEKVTFEVELGPTISNLKGGFNFDFNSHSGNIVDRSLMGFLGSAALRYYPSQDLFAMNEFYVSPKLRFRQYNTLFENIQNSNDTQTGARSEFTFFFNMGTQRWKSDNFALDFYAGAGIGSYNKKSYDLNVFYDGNGQYISEWKKFTQREARFVLQVGMKVTIGN